MPTGALQVLSLCAGDGRDLLAVLEDHPRRHDVTALLVDSDDALVASGRRRAAELGLPAIQFVAADAGDAASLGASTAMDLVLACGVFGNVSDADVRTTITALSVLLKETGIVVWTRHRRPPDLTPTIRAWFADAGFEEIAFVEVPNSSGAVGCHRLVTKPPVARAPARLFHFVGDGSAAHL